MFRTWSPHDSYSDHIHTCRRTVSLRKKTSSPEAAPTTSSRFSRAAAPPCVRTVARASATTQRLYIRRSVRTQTWQVSDTVSQQLHTRGRLGRSGLLHCSSLQYGAIHGSERTYQNGSLHDAECLPHGHRERFHTSICAARGLRLSVASVRCSRIVAAHGATRVAREDATSERGNARDLVRRLRHEWLCMDGRCLDGWIRLVTFL